MYRKVISLIITMAFLFSLASCATIMSGRNQELPVYSNPSGALVTVGATQQRSPATFVLDRRKAAYTIRVEKDGYEPAEIHLKRGINGWVWGNILLGGIIGLAIDMGTGSANKFTPDEVEVNLVKERLGYKNLDGKDILFVRLVEK